MRTLEFSITINAPRTRVWQVLWQDETLRQWAGIIDPGTHMVGELKQGEEIQFISGNGYGVTSLVEAVMPNEKLVLRHKADTAGGGTQTRDDQWSGGAESYDLTENEGLTTVTTRFDVPPELEDYFNDTYPKALAKVQQLAED